MSLKALHIVFVTASVLMAFGIGGWSFDQYHQQGALSDLYFGIGWIVFGLGMIVYGKMVLKKLKNISFL